MVNTEHGWRGGENQVFLLARDLPAPWQAITVCQPGSPLARRLRDAGKAVVEVPMSGGGDLLAVRAIRRLVRQHRAMALHAHTSHAHSLCRLAAIGNAVPLVVTRRANAPVKRGMFSRWKYGRRVTRFVAVSNEVRRLLLAGGVPEEHCALILDGVDCARLDAAPPVDLHAELRLPAHALLVGNAAALVAVKDHRTLLDAWLTVERTSPIAHLVIAGTGELEAELRAQAMALGLNRVHFLGFRADVPGLLKRCTLFTLCSRQEGLGSSIMEAMRCGLPVVATRIGGIPELVEDETNGLLVAVGDAPALAAALLRPLSDARLRERLAEAARASAEARFSHQHMVAAYAALYTTLSADSAYGAPA